MTGERPIGNKSTQKERQDVPKGAFCRFLFLGRTLAKIGFDFMYMGIWAKNHQAVPLCQAGREHLRGDGRCPVSTLPGQPIEAGRQMFKKPRLPPLDNRGRVSFMIEDATY